ncbi:hypothetical protein DOO78_23745 [Roseicella frigidaeris]|uniref:Uncharacterized protein n=1 Tax=Roseicella frigidaeris TaxID=2230885 RepID=A0A327LXI0_9PROT|nr:hypothetical protein DOO78_23745 [Roseicella frigidaeris]
MTFRITADNPHLPDNCYDTVSMAGRGCGGRTPDRRPSRGATAPGAPPAAPPAAPARCPCGQRGFASCQSRFARTAGHSGAVML